MNENEAVPRNWRDWMPVVQPPEDESRPYGLEIMMGVDKDASERLSDNIQNMMDDGLAPWTIAAEVQKMGWVTPRLYAHAMFILGIYIGAAMAEQESAQEAESDHGVIVMTIGPSNPEEQK